MEAIHNPNNSGGRSIIVLRLGRTPQRREQLLARQWGRHTPRKGLPRTIRPTYRPQPRVSVCPMLGLQDVGTSRLVPPILLGFTMFSYSCVAKGMPWRFSLFAAVEPWSNCFYCSRL